MTLIALLIGLFVERLATRLFHLRRLRWLDRAIDFGFSQRQKIAIWPAVIPLFVLAIALVLPVFLIWFGSADIWLGFPYLVLAVIVLFFSLGPKDLNEDVEEYCQAVEENNESRINETAKSLIEKDVPPDAEHCMRRVEESICVQANNRLFAVVFWFVLLGPVGAWAYRVTDLIRRRAVFNSMRAEESDDGKLVVAAEMLHGLVAWVPARLTAVGYAMAGSFDGALSAWKNPQDGERKALHEQSEQLLARVGIGALGLQTTDGEKLAERRIRGAKAANGIVVRQFILWMVFIGAMTLYGAAL